MSRSIPNLNATSGFTLVEILLVLTLVGILSVVSVDMMSDTLNESRFEETVAKLQQIQSAIIGNPLLRENGGRTSFGFLGDIGALPTAGQGLSSLVAQPAPALPVFAVSSVTRIGMGWNGPYLTGGSTGTDYTKDAWGTPLVYNPAANPPTLTSLGADLAVGGTGLAQDITIVFPPELRVATVSGFICNRAAVFNGLAQVEINYPNGSGVLTQPLVSLAAIDKGQFSFANVPYGVRSITVYRPDKATATPANTLGPVMITVDKPNTNVPCSMIDINP